MILRFACFRDLIRTGIVTALLVLLPVVPAAADPDLPAPASSFEVIPAGSLIIAMDNDKQNIGAPFNLKAYGLANHLLWQSVPIKWAIAAGKGKDGVDFSAPAQREFPSALAGAVLSFRGGPFIIHRDWADFARPHITSFGNNVAVYELTADTAIDIRHYITQRRRAAVFDDGGNAGIHIDILDEAGFTPTTHYEIISVATLSTINSNSCFTSGSEPHFGSATADNETQAIRAFIGSGGNFLAQCEAIETYENNAAFGLFQTTNGVAENNIGESFIYHNHDLPFAQFHGNVTDAGGSVQDFELAAGSSFRARSHMFLQDTPTTSSFAATGTKVNAGGPGSLVFYMGGHSYPGNSLEDFNARRMYMNFVMTPSVRPGICSLDIDPDPTNLKRVSGTVYEDINGDSLLADAVPVPGVRVRVYSDLNNNGVVDTGDGFAGEILTAADGTYTVQVNAAPGFENYIVTVDSKTVAPFAGLNGGFNQDDVWAQQTYGDDPATAAVDIGARFGGRVPGVSDDVDSGNSSPAASDYQHLARVDLSGADVSNVDFAFSFNVVTNTRAGDNADDAGGEDRTVQGSLRQFLDNANAIAGANRMRFVPAVPTNASGSGANWWRVDVTEDFEAFLDSFTIVDGAAYSSSNGITLRNDNSSNIGTGGTAGVDSIALPRLDPELEIFSSNQRKIGLDIQASNTTIRNIAISGFGTKEDNDGDTNIRVDSVSGTLIERNVIGASPALFSNPSTGAKGDSIRISGAGSGDLRDNLIGFAFGNGVALTNDASNWRLERNEVTGTGLVKTALSGILLEEASNITVRANLLRDNRGSGLDVLKDAPGTTVENNTVRRNGLATDLTPGIRLASVGNSVDRNILNDNYGAGIMVLKDATANRISRNSIYDNGTIAGDGGESVSGQIGIDLIRGEDDATGDAPFVTLNDSGDGDTGGNGRLNYPVLDSALLSMGQLMITGWARPGSVIELFLAAPDPTGFGEGRRYLVT
ncbi:MAG: right-handed parallel beta-helix repeat-containing protein, partial [Gammaproteobacteria bacterium]|nr:right-handed parallel beta-helix repeat-containing protein [Gammaproteobacteria bacterium]